MAAATEADAIVSTPGDAAAVLTAARKCDRRASVRHVRAGGPAWGQPKDDPSQL